MCAFTCSTVAKTKYRESGVKANQKKKKKTESAGIASWSQNPGNSVDFGRMIRGRRSVTSNSPINQQSVHRQVYKNKNPKMKQKTEVIPSYCLRILRSCDKDILK